MNQSKELQLAILAAKEAGKYLKNEKDIYVNSCDGKDIKLSSDKASEKIIMNILEKSGISILSEEFGFEDKASEDYWIVDPLDGTINYYKNFREMACVSIALWRGGRPVLGVVYRFVTDELFFGEEGYGAYLNGKEIKTSSIEKISDAIVATGFPVKRNYDTNSLTQFIGQVQHAKKIRMLGAAAIMSTFVACGKFDMYIEEEIMLWDVAAGVALVNAAGGCTILELLKNHKCICRCFANRDLMEDYNAQSI